MRNSTCKRRTKSDCISQWTTNRHEAVARLLLDEGVDNVNDIRSRTAALHGMVSSGHEVMAQLLLERGADTTTKNKKGETAL